MKLRSKETYWLLKNGLINSYPSLRENISCDVLIIGGGITGSLIAHQLSQEGYQTVLIDKRDIAMGSTCATTAMLQYEIDEPLHTLINKVGERAAVDTYREGVLAIDRLGEIVKTIHADCGFHKKHSVYIADSKKSMEFLWKEFECRKQYKLDVTWLSKPELRNQFGMVGEGAILSEAAASVDAYTLAHALLAYSVAHDQLRVFDHTSSEDVHHKDSRSTITTDNKNTIECQHVVYATGYEAQPMLKRSAVTLNSTYAFVSEPLSSIPESLLKTIFWNTQDPYLYMRTTADNRMLVGGGDEEFKNAARRDRLMERKELFLLKEVSRLLPDVNLIPDFTWAGTFGVTKDALPYIGKHPEYPNSYVVLGFGGNGITFSVMGMSIISDAIAGRTNPFLEYFSLER